MALLFRVFCFWIGMISERQCAEGTFRIVGGMRVWQGPEAIAKHVTRLALGGDAEAKQRWTRGEPRQV